MKKAMLLTGLLGLGLAVYLYHNIGWENVFLPLLDIGWAAGFIFLPFLLTNYVNTWAWVCTFPPPFAKYRVPFSHLYWMRIAGEFINNFTPTAHIGGDVARAWMLKRYKIPSTVGLTTIVMDKAALVITEILFIFTGIFLFVLQADLSTATMFVVVGAAGGAILVAYAIIATLHKGVFSKMTHALSTRWNLKSLESLHDKIIKLDLHLTQFYRNHHNEFLRSNYLHYIGWAMGTLETWTLLYLLGMPVSLLDAFMIESIIMLVKGLGFFIPGSLGVYEGGSLLLFQVLNFDQGLGLTFTMMKRAREIVCGLMGWIFVSIKFSFKLSNVPQTVQSEE